MPYAVGIALGVGVAAFAALMKFDRDRSFYPTVLIVIASYNILFAVMGAPTKVLLCEILAASLFFGLAILGFRGSTWILAAAIAGHGAFDSIHGLVIPNPGVPVWWPAFCMAIDVTLGALLALRILRR